MLSECVFISQFTAVQLYHPPPSICMIIMCCQDYNECQTSGMCTHGRCINLAGSFKCICDPGFTESQTGEVCVGKFYAILLCFCVNCNHPLFALTQWMIVINTNTTLRSSELVECCALRVVTFEATTTGFIDISGQCSFHTQRKELPHHNDHIGQVAGTQAARLHYGTADAVLI